MERVQHQERGQQSGARTALKAVRIRWKHTWNERWIHILREPILAESQDVQTVGW